MLGRKIRLSRIFRPNGRTVIVPMDDALISGPVGQLERSDDLIRLSTQVGADAILAYPGTLSQIEPQSTLGRIQNVTASTLMSSHTRKYLVGTIQQAVADGVDAVAVHINISSKFEHEMVTNFGSIVAEAQPYGLPVIAIVYPRKEWADGSDDNYEVMKKEDPKAYCTLVAHCTRIAAELGADTIKTQYTGSPESFAQVVRTACSVPIVIAGGPLLPWPELKSMVVGALEAGAAGVSVGRNVHQALDRHGTILRDLVELVHNS